MTQDSNKKFCNKKVPNARVDGKVALVTGANCGIGLETARALNLAGAKVYLLCRSAQRTQDAIQQLVQEGCDGSRLIYQNLDLASFENIRACAENMLQKENIIDILINNAGIMNYPKYELTIDGHEMTWQSNHLGPFLLTELLLPAIKRAEKGRIILVSSSLHKAYRRKIDFTTVDSEKEFGTWEPYNRTKLANVMHARALAKRLQDEEINNVTVNSLHPGAVNTNLQRNVTGGWKIVFSPMKLFFKTPVQGAQTSIYLALNPKVEDVTGKYFSDSALDSENSVALDDTNCQELYNYSLQTVGLH